MNKNSLDTNFILFDRFKTSNNSPIIDFINSKEDIINKNYRKLINVGNEKLNWDKVFKIKKTNIFKLIIKIIHNYQEHLHVLIILNMKKKIS